MLKKTQKKEGKPKFTFQHYELKNNFNLTNITISPNKARLFDENKNVLFTIKKFRTVVLKLGYEVYDNAGNCVATVDETGKLTLYGKTLGYLRYKNWTRMEMELSFNDWRIRHNDGYTKVYIEGEEVARGRNFHPDEEHMDGTPNKRDSRIRIIMDVAFPDETLLIFMLILIYEYRLKYILGKDLYKSQKKRERIEKIKTLITKDDKK